jgi:hypothetical protein
VKVDFDASPKLIAQLEQAQAVLYLPAGLPLISFITPDGRLYFGAGYLLLNTKTVSHLFTKPLMRLLPASRIDPSLKSNHFSWSQKNSHEKVGFVFLSNVYAKQPATVCDR